MSTDYVDINSFNLIEFSGMKVVSGQKTPNSSRERISAKTRIFPCGISTVKELQKNPGSQVSSIPVLPILSPVPNSVFLRFYIIATAKVIQDGIQHILLSVNLPYKNCRKSAKTRRSFIPEFYSAVSRRIRYRTIWLLLPK